MPHILYLEITITAETNLFRRRRHSITTLHLCHTGRRWHFSRFLVECLVVYWYHPPPPDCSPWREGCFGVWWVCLFPLFYVLSSSSSGRPPSISAHEGSMPFEIQQVHQPRQGFARPCRLAAKRRLRELGHPFRSYHVPFIVCRRSVPRQFLCMGFISPSKTPSSVPWTNCPLPSSLSTERNCCVVIKRVRNYFIFT